MIRILQGELVSADEQARVESRVAELRRARASSLAVPLHAARDGGWFLLATPFVHGVPLDERFGSGGIDVAPTLQVAGDLLRAVATAHEHGLTRLDLRPSNVIVNPDGRIRSATLVGFATAILRDCLAGGDLAPAVADRAPELVGAVDRPVDGRADVYAAGLIIHECLTGRPVHTGETDGELLRWCLTDRPSRLRPTHPDLPAGVEAEILRMLEVDADDRPADATEALAAIFGPPATDRPGYGEPTAGDARELTAGHAGGAGEATARRRARAERVGFTTPVSCCIPVSARAKVV